MKLIIPDLPMPIISTRLILRPPQIGDAITLNDAVLETFDILHASVAWAKTMPSISDSEEYICQSAANWDLKNAGEPTLPLFIFHKITGDFIGCTGFVNLNWEVPCVETGYWIRKKYAGQGLMTEALNAVTRYAINQMGVKRIEIRCDIDNIRSKKIPERLGYCLEATLKSNRVNPITGLPSDTLIYVRHNLYGIDK